MAISHSPKSLFPFSLLFLLFSLLHFPPLSFSADYTPPDRYFINCGSDSDITVNRRNFLADVNPASFSVTGDHTTRVTVSDTSNQLPTTSPLYHTARIFHKQSSYELNISDNGTYMVRFHFYPFTSPGNNLFNSDFTLSASGLTLFSNFTPNQNNTPSLPIIKEFLLRINAGLFKINFIPSKDSSFAFVNAIEAFLLPQDFIPNHPLDHVTLSGRINGDYSILQSHGLQPIHRINVGGPVLTQDNDTLWRNWVTDDDYIYSEESAITSQPYTGTLNYQDGGATNFDAPDLVYATAKQLNTDPSRQVFNVNMSWNFIVSKNSTSLVRVHFCDIVSGGSGAGGLTNGYFSLYIFRQFTYRIEPGPRTLQLYAPFYIDFVVDSDREGYVNISIGQQREYNFTPFLNGLEIMELVNLGSGLGFSEGGKKKKSTVIIIGCVVGGVGLLVILVGVLFFGLKFRKAKAVANSDWNAVPQYGGDSYSMMTIERSGNNASPLPGLNLGLKIPFTEILQATKNFNPELMIGEGGFGKVYKGVLSNGMKVAVKRSQPGQEQGFSEFQTEIIVLSKIRHRHLVSLIGYCDERSEMILVYEFMEKGTLREHLYGSNGERANPGSDLPWNQRLQICICAAKGLHYLHTGSGGIIHRDVKSTNILLDEQYVAKVADFGLSRLGDPLDQSQAPVSMVIKGSFGYLDPEYFSCLTLTQKSDVYSFGVVLLEVLCARPAVNTLLPRDEVNLAEWGLSWLKKGEVGKIMDPTLTGTINPNSLRKFVETIDKCLKQYGDERPNMIDVLWDLEYSLQLQQTTVVREPHEDSTTDVSWSMPMGVLHRLPSDDDTAIDDSDVRMDQVNESPESGYSNLVFSQLKMDDAR